MSGTELSRVRTQFRLPLLEPINKSPLESSGAGVVMQSSGFGRVQRREMGVKHREYIARSATLHAILDTARLEDFTISMENRSPTDVANEMLLKAGWVAT